MFHYELSKYNPKYRVYNNRYRFYSRFEWTGISDIGKLFDDGILSLSDYLKSEDMYLTAVKTIMKYKNVDALMWKSDSFCKWQNSETIKSRISCTPYRELYTDEIYTVYDNLKDGVVLDEINVESVIRLFLREEIGGILTSPRKLKIFVGYDYLMGIDSSSSLLPIQKDIEEIGLFLEGF